MATAIRPLRKFQVGMQTVFDTGVAATRQLVGNAVASEPIDRFHAAYPRGIRGTVGSTGSNLMKSTKYAYDSVLSAEEFLWPLHTGIRSSLSATQQTATGTSTATSSSTMTDSGATWTVNGFVGCVVTIDGKTGTISSNTATVLTVASWTGGTPTSVSAYSIAKLSYLWTATPQLTTGIPTLLPASVEYAESDGSTNHLLVSSANNYCTGFKVGGAFNKEATMSWEWVGGYNAAAAPTGALTPYTALETLVSPLMFLYLDSSWTNLGNTQQTVIVRSVSFECMTGIALDYTMDGRSNLDASGYKIAGPLAAKLSLSVELNATAATAYIAAFRSNTNQFIRLKFTGSTITGGGGDVKYVQIDGSYRFTGEPKVTYDGDQALVSADFEAVYDSTGTSILLFKVMNTLSAI